MKPVGAIKQIVSQSEFWLERVALTMKKKRNVIIITGEIGSGKTTLLSAISSGLAGAGIQTGGIIASAVYEQDAKTGYTITDVANGKKMLLSNTRHTDGMARVGRYFFFPEAIDFGREALSAEKNRYSQIVLIDEIGAWELQGQGWATSLNELIINCDMPLIITVRKSFLDMVIENWMLQNPLVIEAEGAVAEDVLGKILKFSGIHVNFEPNL